MAYDASFWRERRNWSALTGALTGAATRKDYPAMLRHIEAARAAGMPEEQIRRAYSEVVLMLPNVPALEMLEQTASGSAPAPAAPFTTSAAPTVNTPPTTSPDPASRPASPAPEAPPARPSGWAAPATVETTPAPSSPPPMPGLTAADSAAATSGPADPTGRPVVQQLDYWLTLLRTGDDATRIEARGNLAVIFEQRGLLAEAIEMLEGNVQAGVRDANIQRRLSALYRQIGRQDLADKAISDLYQLGMTGGSATSSTAVTPDVTTVPASPYGWLPARPVEAEAREAPPVEPAVPEPPAWRRPRPAWLVISLTIATFGLYAYYWLFATWREIKHETDDASMHPFWHLIGVGLIPIYGWIRFYDHIRKIRRLGLSAGTGTTLSPGLCVWLFIITAVVNRLTVRIEPWTPTPPWLDLMVLAVITILVAWPQATLTCAWQRLPGGAAPFRVHGFEWLLLILGGIVWAGILGGVAPP